MSKCDVKYRIEYLEGATLHSIPRACEREVFANGKCILHSDDPQKPLEPILGEIRRQYEEDEYFDLCHVIFPLQEFKFPVPPSMMLFMDDCIFNGPTSFNSLRFEKRAYLRHCEFREDADFGDGADYTQVYTRFIDTVDFTSTVFKKTALFRGCSFNADPKFMATVFEGTANFSFAVLRCSGTEGNLAFHQTQFRKDAYLHFRIQNTLLKTISFAYGDLHGLDISSLPRDKITLKFSEIQKWNTDRKWYQAPRPKIFDETRYANRPVEVVATYRDLEKYFYDSSDFGLAAQFHIGQQVMRRKTPGYGRAAKVVNLLYQIVSSYGYSVVRPLLFLLLIWLLFPVLLLNLGMPVYRMDGSETHIVDARYGVSDMPGTLMTKSFWNDYSSVLFSNFALSTIDRKHELSPRADSFQRFLIIFETATVAISIFLLIVAIRRKFKPPKPLSDEI